MKQKLEKAAERYVKLQACSVLESGSESSDSDFEEVEEKEGYERVAKEEFAVPTTTSEAKMKPRSQPSWNIWSEENNELVIGLYSCRYLLSFYEIYVISCFSICICYGIK